MTTPTQPQPAGRAVTGQGSRARVGAGDAGGYRRVPNQVVSGRPVFPVPDEADPASLPILPTDLTDRGWQLAGVCMDPAENDDLWWPEYLPVGERVAAEVEAREGCAVCPVRRECLGFAIASGQDVGIAGGLNPAERIQVATVLKIKVIRHGTVLGYTRDRCRCDRCRNAKSAYERQRYEQGRSWRQQTGERPRPVGSVIDVDFQSRRRKADTVRDESVGEA